VAIGQVANRSVNPVLVASMTTVAPLSASSVTVRR
jgi:hypothetical protein